ncbi:hypothetical protein [Aestuariispira insulae]|uniref:Uncharacterized protein n=1 Tax=Aestuariispira insulae TaxID=1461337 RepID=A0A3D9H3Q6_9PROT|nr:hypothetical protein [Aestuariispira insulae]RED44134.1 hypothetical protein DFP90_11738 [Aestuariispira insulae]
MAELQELGRAIAPLLPGAWRYNAIKSKDGNFNEWGSRAILTNDSIRGQGIGIGPYWNKHRFLKIGGLLPGDDWGRSQFTIGVSANRTPEAITGDIKRRLLNEYAAEWMKTQEEYFKQQKEADAWREKVELLDNIIPIYDGYSYHHEKLKRRGRFRFKYGFGNVYSEDFTKLELDLSFNQLVRVMVLLAKMEPD